MRNETTNRQAFNAAVSLVCYIVFCYIAFSEPWPAGAMKLFMAVVITSAVLFVYSCGKLSSVSIKNRTADSGTPIPGYSAAK